MDEEFHSRSGFLDVGEILSLVTEEEIFSLVFGFEPEEYQRSHSPFRQDNNPDCYFEVDPNKGKLMFIDFAGDRRHSDCFDAVRDYYNLPNFYQVLLFIKANLIDGKTRTQLEQKVKVKKNKPKTGLIFKSRYFIECDKTFWSKFKIRRAHLIEDKVFPVSKYQLQKDGKGVTINSYTPTYAYTEFESGNRKLYFPYKKDLKFLTNCTQNDVGGLHNVDHFSDTLIITKSYKDYRVIYNQGYNVIWFQNEGMIPEDEILINIIKIGKYRKIYVLFDNDDAGVRAVIKVSEYLRSCYFVQGDVIPLHLPLALLKEGIKDPADLVEKRRSEYQLQKFLNDNTEHYKQSSP